MALFDALAMQNFDWLFLKAKPAVNNRVSSHLVSVGRYGLQTSGMSGNRVAKCYTILRTRSLECHEMLLLVLHDNTKNGWVWHRHTKIMKQYLYVLKISFSYIYFSFRIPYAFDRALWPLSDQSPSRVWRLSVRSLWTIPVCSLHQCWTPLVFVHLQVSFPFG